MLKRHFKLPTSSSNTVQPVYTIQVEYISQEKANICEIN